jgi:hypothetical protein
MRSKLVSVVIVILVVSLAGCEAFARKFTRKPKTVKTEELVLAPEEYKPPSRTPEEVYRGYFLFWKSWQDELINALAQDSSSRKKRIDCAQEALKNLTSMRDMLDDASWKKINKYVIQLADQQIRYPACRPAGFSQAGFVRHQLLRLLPYCGTH